MVPDVTAILAGVKTAELSVADGTCEFEGTVSENASRVNAGLKN